MSACEDNLNHQLDMLDVTWEQFVENGVDENSELNLEFMFLAPSKEMALSLSNALDDYQTEIKSEGLFKKKWFVEGATDPTNVSKEILVQWLEFMISKGWEFGCEFDGFGASMP